MNKATIIGSVYDKVNELELILYALSIQSFRDFELIIAEDGQNDKIKRLVGEWQKKNLLNIKHITQEDKGFRKNRILNEAIRKSSADYLIFIDGDCVPHSDFIKAHFENRGANTVLCGRRVNLTKTISGKINRDSIVNLDYQKIKLPEVIFSALNRDKSESNFNIEEGIILKKKFFRKIVTNEDEHILGCNFSIHKELLKKINGFDEKYEGPGLGEDSDIEFRLRLIGAEFKSVRNLAVLYHMHHSKTKEEPKNMEYFIKVKEENKSFCSNGLEYV